VYARHGHELMGCKSPVGVPALSQCASVITTSRRQGRIREDGSEGSPSAKVRAEEHEPHRRLSPGASQHNMTKPAGHTGQGKCGGCASTVHVLIRGDLLDRQRTARWVDPVGFWMNKPVHPEGCHSDASERGSSPRVLVARRPVTGAVIGKKSAEAIVARRGTRPGPRRAEPGSTGRSRG